MAMIIALVARTRPLPAILSVNVLSSLAIAFLNLTPAPRSCRDRNGKGDHPG